MLKMIERALRYYEKVLHNLISAIQKEDVIKYEILFLAISVASILVIVSLAALPLGVHWKLPMHEVMGFFSGDSNRRIRYYVYIKMRDFVKPCKGAHYQCYAHCIAADYI